MTEVIKKIISAEIDISKERGDFRLFGVFERNDLINKWDIVVSANWLDHELKSNYDYLSQKIIPLLDVNEISLFSRFVILTPDEPFVGTINQLFAAEHSSMELKNCSLNGILINHCFIITSKFIK